MEQDQPRPTRLVVSPGSVIMYPGDSCSIMAIIRDSKDRWCQNITPEFISCNPTIADVDQLGIIRANNPGIGLITVKIPSTFISESVTVQVENRVLHWLPNLVELIINPSSIISTE